MALPRVRWLLATLILLAGVRPAAAIGQVDIEAYQLVSMSVGWGAIRPAEATGLDGEAADGAGSLQLAVSMDIRQASWALVYARLEADVAPVRQHLAFGAGFRFMPLRAGDVRPYLGGGLGLLWLEPRVDASNVLLREYRLRADGHIGAEWSPLPGLSWFAEYRIAGARFTAIGQQPDCQPVGQCLEFSTGEILHVGHTGWLGMRIRII
jgi:hypothetical protein